MTCRHDAGKSAGPLCPDCAPARLYAEAARARACAVAGVDLDGLRGRTIMLLDAASYALGYMEGRELGDTHAAVRLKEEIARLTAALWPREGT